MKIYVITEFVDLGDATAEKEFIGVELSLEDVDWRCREIIKERKAQFYFDGKYKYEDFKFNESNTGWGGTWRGNFFTIFDILEFER